MAIAYKSSGAGNGTETTSAALELVCPASVDANDILIAHIIHTGTSTGPSTPSGWDLLYGPANVGTTATARHWVFGKIAAGTEDGATINFGTDGGSNGRAGRIYSFSGYVSGAITDVVPSASFSTTPHATDPQGPSVTTTVAGALAVACMCQDDDNSEEAIVGMSGGTWGGHVEYSNATWGPQGIVLYLNVCTPTANPGTVSGGSIAAANDEAGTIGFEIRPNIPPQSLSGTAASSVWSIVAQTLVAGAIALSGLAAASTFTVPAHSLVSLDQLSDEWGRKCAITLSHANVDSDLSNFPVVLTEASLPSEMLDADGSYPAQLGGGDIRFSSDADGLTQLPCHVVTFIPENTPANGKALIYVKVPTLAGASDTTIYVWYDGPADSVQRAASDPYGREAVWNSDFVGVWPLQGRMAQTLDEVRYLGGYGGTNPVIAPGTVGQSDYYIHEEHGGAVWDPNTNQYLLVYVGHQGTYGTNTYIHGATSPDGKVWTKCSAKPLINARQGDDPYLVIDGSTYYIVCEDIPNTNILLYSCATFDADWDSVGTYHGTMLAPAASGQWDDTGVGSPVLWKEGSTWYLLYEGSGDDWATGAMGCATASTPTGTWTREPTNPVFVVADTDWASTTVVSDDVWKDADGYYWLTYHADNGTGSQPGIARSTTANSLTAWTDSSYSPMQSDVDQAATWPASWGLTRTHGGFLHYYHPHTGAQTDGICLGYGIAEFGTDGHVEDATASHVHGVIQSGITRANLMVAGKVGRAIDFDGGAGDGIQIAHNAVLNLSSLLSLTAVVRSDTDPDGGVAEQWYIAKGDSNFQLSMDHTTAGYRKCFTYASSVPQATDTSDLAADTWYVFTGRRGATNADIDRDGTNRASVARGTIVTNGDPLRIGGWGSTAWDGYFAGRLQEIRLSGVDRGVAWHKAEWANLDSPGTFAVAGTPESPGVQALSGSAASSTWAVVSQSIVAGTVALSGSSASSAWVIPAQTLASVYALSGASPFATFTVPAQTLVPGASALSGAAAVSTFTVPSHTLVPGSIALSGSAGVATFTVPGQTLIASAVALSGAASTSSWAIPAQMLVQGDVALSGAAGIATWAVPSQTLVSEGGSQSLLGSAAISTWSVTAQTLVPGSASLSGASAISTFTIPSQTLVPGSVALSGVAGVATWAIPAQALQSATALSGLAATATWAIPSATLVPGAVAVTGTAALATWAVVAAEVLHGGQMSGPAAYATWTVPATGLTTILFVWKRTA